MSLLSHLEFQPIDDSDRDEISPSHRPEEPITLDDDTSEEQLDAFWDGVVQDMHKDPTRLNFSDK